MPFSFRMKTSSTTPPDAPRKHWRALLAVVAATGLTDCAQVTGLNLFESKDETAVVYALGSREGFTSPLNASLKPVIPAFEFADSRIELSVAQIRALDELAAAWEKDHSIRYLIVGYSPPNLPEDHARSLSERRALGVRQHLIEQGVESVKIQALGLGNDFARTSPTSHIVVIHQQ